MNIEQIKRKNIVLIEYLQRMFKDIKIVAEYSTNYKNEEVIVVEEVSGTRVVFFSELDPLYNYYTINIFANSIQKAKDISVQIANKIGTNEIIEIDQTEKWQVMIKQFTNPQAVEYEDIRRISYNMTIQCVVNMIAKKNKEE